MGARHLDAIRPTGGPGEGVRHDRTLAAAGVQLVIPPVTLMLVTLAAQSAPFRFDFAGSVRSG